jgi:hypothetical protein
VPHPAGVCGLREEVRWTSLRVRGRGGGRLATRRVVKLAVGNRTSRGLLRSSGPLCRFFVKPKESLLPCHPTWAVRA